MSDDDPKKAEARRLFEQRMAEWTAEYGPEEAARLMEFAITEVIPAVVRQEALERRGGTALN